MFKTRWSVECFTKTTFSTKKNGGTHHASALGLVWKDPKGFLILTKFKGSSSLLKFDHFFQFSPAAIWVCCTFGNIFFNILLCRDQGQVLRGWAFEEGGGVWCRGEVLELQLLLTSRSSPAHHPTSLQKWPNFEWLEATLNMVKIKNPFGSVLFVFCCSQLRARQREREIGSQGSWHLDV